MKKKIITIIAVIVACACLAGYYFFKAPKVSIVMPVYNGAKYLEQTVGFLLASDFRDFEFVIIDDGSTDNSWEKLKELAEADSRIKLYKNEKNMGIVKTRNRGFDLARGKYIAPMDQDDWSMPNRLSLEVTYLDNHPDVDIVDVGTILMASYHRGIKEERMGGVSYMMESYENEEKRYTLDERDENIKLSLFFSLAVPTQSGAMMRRKFLEDNHIRYTEGIRYADDYYLYADMMKAGARFHHIDDIAHVYNDIREHEKAFVQKQIDEVYEVKKDLFAWAGIDFEGYDNLEIEAFMCKLFDDLVQVAPEKSRFSKALLEKNKKLLCEK